MPTKALVLTIGALIKAVRTRRKLTPAEMAAKVGVSASTLGRWERSTAVPSPKHHKALAKALGVSQTYLREVISGKVKETAPPSKKSRSQKRKALPILVPPQGGYTAKQCDVKTHKDNDPNYLDEWKDPFAPDVLARMESGIVFESMIGDLLKTSMPEGYAVFLEGDRSEKSKRARERATMAAMRANVPFIWNARLPVTKREGVLGSRISEPDALALIKPGTRTRKPVYAGVDVKDHKLLSGSTIPKYRMLSPLLPTSPEVKLQRLEKAASLIDTEALRIAQQPKVVEPEPVEEVAEEGSKKKAKKKAEPKPVDPFNKLGNAFADLSPTTSDRIRYQLSQLALNVNDPDFNRMSLVESEQVGYSLHPSDADPVLLGGAWVKKDALQLAHYERHLEEHGFGGSNIGGIIGKAINGEFFIIWYKLDSNIFQKDDVFGEREHLSALDIYDASFVHHRKVIHRALERGNNPKLLPLVFPEKKTECAECPWKSNCKMEMQEADQVTLIPTVTPARAQAHYIAGISTVEALSNLDAKTAMLVDAKIDVRELMSEALNKPAPRPATEILRGTLSFMEMSHAYQDEAYDVLPRAGVHTVNDIRKLDALTALYSGLRVGKLTKSIDQARVSRVGRIHRARGVSLEEATVPRADIELDVDMENDPSAGGIIYLWGVYETVLVKGKETKRYVPFVTWDATDEGEAKAFGAFWKYLKKWRNKAHREGKSFKAYCYSGAENRCMRAIVEKSAGKFGVPEMEELLLFTGIKAKDVPASLKEKYRITPAFSPDDEAATPEKKIQGDSRVKIKFPAVLPLGRPYTRGHVADIDLNIDIPPHPDWVDMYPIVSKKAIFPTESYTLKETAKYARHVWRDESPSGSESVIWYYDAIDGPDEITREAAKERILQYNEDDVLGTRVERIFISSLLQTRDPERRFPSVATLDAKFGPAHRK